MQRADDGGRPPAGHPEIGRSGGAPFTADDEELLAAVANQVAFSVGNALAFQEIAALKDKLAAEKVYLEEEIRTDYNFEEIIGQSSALKSVLHQAGTVAPTDSTVLILGGQHGHLDGALSAPPR